MRATSSPGGSWWARLLAAVFLLFSAAAVSARQDVVIHVDDHALVAMKVSAPFDVLPPGGYTPLEVLIDNSSGSAGVWTVRFRQTGRSSRQDEWTTESSFAVDAHSQRTFALMLPLASPALRNDQLLITAEGPGISGRTTEAMRVGQNDLTAPGFVGVSESLTLDVNSFPKLKADENVARFAIAGAPSDWRGWAGFDMLWMTLSDVALLSAPQRAALEDWIALGGSLHLFGATERPASLAAEGVGSVVMHPESKIDDPVGLETTIKQPRAAWFDDFKAQGWGALDDVPPVRPNVPLLAGVLLALAITMGPINLYVFAGKGRRARLLWTTPLISLGASVALGSMIFLADGAGGSGEREALIFLLPGQSKAAVWQEQLTRTGVLFSTWFYLANPGLLIPITPEDLGSPGEHIFATHGQDYSGSWFTNRAREGCYFQAIIPTRGEVQLLNPEALATVGTAPTVVSSIDLGLDDLYVIAAGRWLWRGEHLRAGERQTLRRVEGHMPTVLPKASPALRHRLDLLPDTPGSFLAHSSDARAFQETLPAIRWQEQRAVFAGQLIPAK